MEMTLREFFNGIAEWFSGGWEKGKASGELNQPLNLSNAGMSFVNGCSQALSENLKTHRQQKRK